MDMTNVKSFSINGKKVVSIDLNGTRVWRERAIGTYELLLYPARHQENVDSSDGTLGIAFEVQGVGDWYIDGQHIGAIDNNELASIYYDEVEEREYRVTFVGAFEQISTVAKSTTSAAVPATDLREVLQWDNTRTSTYKRQFYYAGQNIEKLKIPSFITEIAEGTFAYSGLKTVCFEQPQGIAVSLPVAGSATGMFYSKNAKEMTIYTDNETIKNYDFATDNVTATVYHLDGTKWEE